MPAFILGGLCALTFAALAVLIGLACRCLYLRRQLTRLYRGPRLAKRFPR